MRTPALSGSFAPLGSFAMAVALAAAVAPAVSAQEEARREIRIVVEDEDGERVERRLTLPGDEDQVLTEADGRRVLVFEGPDGEERRIELDLGPAAWDDSTRRHFRFRLDDGPMRELRRFDLDGEFARAFPDGFPRELGFVGDRLRVLHDELGALGDGLAFGPGLSHETREGLREQEREAARLAREARRADGAERRRLEGELDAVLGRLFDLRGEARAEQAAHLREQAADLERRAAELEAERRSREAERRALIEQRRRELLGEENGNW